MLMQLFARNTLLCQVLYIYDELLPLYHNPSQNVPYSNSTQLLVSFLSSRYLCETNHLYLLPVRVLIFHSIANIHWATLHTQVLIYLLLILFFVQSR